MEIVEEAEVIEPAETNDTTDETNTNNIKKAVDDKLNELLS